MTILRAQPNTVHVLDASSTALDRRQTQNGRRHLTAELLRGDWTYIWYAAPKPQACVACAHVCAGSCGQQCSSPQSELGTPGDVGGGADVMG